MRLWTWLVVAIVASVMATGTAFAQEKKAGKPKMTAEERFQRLDKNSDGAVSLDEFVAPAKKKPELQEGLEKRFKAMDKDNDGKLTLDEFKAAPTGKRKKK